MANGANPSVVSEEYGIPRTKTMNGGRGNFPLPIFPGPKNIQMLKFSPFRFFLKIHFSRFPDECQYRET